MLFESNARIFDTGKYMMVNMVIFLLRVDIRHARWSINPGPSFFQCPLMVT